MDISIVSNNGNIHQITGVKQIEELPYSLEFTTLSGRRWRLAKKDGMILDMEISERSKV